MTDAPHDAPKPTSDDSNASTWALGLRGVEVAWDELSDLLEARGAEVESDDGMLVAELALDARGEADLLIMDALGAWLDNLGLMGAELVTRRGEGPWQEGWRAVFHATPISDRLWVRPAWEPAVAGRGEVVIDPTHAFGAGFHPTTAACLAMLDRALATVAPAVAAAGRGRATVLDVGAGTGILAIAAAHLGADVLGVEIDGQACIDAERNAALNGVAERITIVHDTLRPGQERRDVVVANVLASVLVALAPPILEATGREVILSGIQTSKEDGVRAAYAELALVERVESRGWVTLRLARSA